MTQTQVKQQLTNLFTQFLNGSSLDILKDLKQQIINLYNSIPFDESNSVGKEMELKLLDDTTKLYIDNNLDSSGKSLLFGDFDRLLISVSVSLLED